MKQTTNYQKHTTHNPLQRFLIERFYNNLLALVKEISPHSILDAGCGEGFTLFRLKNMRIGKILQGVDASKEALKLAKRTHPEFPITYGDIYHLPFRSNTFDCVVCTEVLEHLENPRQALSELRRVTKKFLLLSVPHEPLFMLANFLRGKNVRRLGNDIGHINHWTRHGFEHFIQQEKLSTVATKTPFPWTMILAKKV